MTIETFIDDIPWDETFRFGDGSPERESWVSSLAAAVASRASRPGPPRRPRIPTSCSRSERRKALPRCCSRRWASWYRPQRDVPLNTICDRFLGELLGPPGQMAKVSVAPPPSCAGEPHERFAPLSYLQLPDNQAVHVPGFEELPAGILFGAPEAAAPQPHTQPPATRVIRLPAPTILDWGVDLSNYGVFTKLAEVGLATAQVWDKQPRVTLGKETWLTQGTGHHTLVAAWQYARYRSNSLPLHADDPTIDTGSI